MTWFRVQDDWEHHPKWAGASDAAIAAWLKGMGYCSTYTTDGLIPAAVVSRIATRRAVDELVDRRLWKLVPKGARVTHYSEHQRTRREIEADRESARDRQKRSRASRRDIGEVTLTDTDTDTDADTPLTPQGGHDPSCAYCQGTGIFTDQDGRAQACSGGLRVVL